MGIQRTKKELSVEKSCTSVVRSNVSDANYSQLGIVGDTSVSAVSTARFGEELRKCDHQELMQHSNLISKL